MLDDNSSNRAPSRRAWTAAITLTHRRGNTLCTIFTLAASKAEAISVVIQEASKALPAEVGDEYGIFNSHATPIDLAVIRAAADELEPEKAPSDG